MARGIERRKLFLDDKDRESFLDRLAVILEETQTQCYAWALIPNHFHLLLRTGPTPLSKVMRKLMTGYAVTFNKKHKRAGHLFQNRYKSVICEEDPYLLELIRYIHLNPLRAKLVQDLNELDTYPWSGHSAILGNCKNPLVPGVRDHPGETKERRFHRAGRSGGSKQAASLSRPKGLVCSDSDPSSRIRTNQPKTTSFASLAPSRFKDKSLAEKTIEDVLLHFGETQQIARRRYREFVEKGIAQGRRPEFQGGGLVRSAGGNKAGLLGRSKEEREKGDARILGSGGFVSDILDQADSDWQRRQRYDISIGELISNVANKLKIDEKDLISYKRKIKISEARAIICYLAVMELGVKGVHVGKVLKISGQSVSRCIERGRNLLDKESDLYQYLQ